MTEEKKCSQSGFYDLDVFAGSMEALCFMVRLGKVVMEEMIELAILGFSLCAMKGFQYALAVVLDGLVVVLFRAGWFGDDTS